MPIPSWPPLDTINDDWIIINWAWETWDERIEGQYRYRRLRDVDKFIQWNYDKLYAEKEHDVDLEIYWQFVYDDAQNNIIATRRQRQYLRETENNIEGYYNGKQNLNTKQENERPFD